MLISLLPPLSTGKAGGPGSAPALWMTTVAGERIFQYSRERVFTEEPVPDVNEEGAADGTENIESCISLTYMLKCVMS